MQIPQLPPDQIAKLKEMIEKGPPPEPGGQNSGRYMQMMTAFETRYKEINKRDPTSEEYLGYLVHILDHRDWEEQMLRFVQMKAVYEANTPPLIARPGFIPPENLKLGKTGE